MYSGLVIVVACIAVSAAEIMPPARQNALVKQYCAVCHTDAAKNGGLSLEHYDAAETNPALAAMILSKLRNGAMGAAGFGIPDPASREAWVEATAAQAERAGSWTLIRTGPVVTASIVRDVTPRQAGTKDAPVYRLTLACDIGSHMGDMQLTWSPAPQSDRTFSVAVDGNAGIAQRLEGKEKAAVILHAPLAEKTLTVNDLFPGESVVFPLAELNQADRRQLAMCLR